MVYFKASWRRRCNGNWQSLQHSCDKIEKIKFNFVATRMLARGEFCVQSIGELAKQGQQHVAPPPPVVRQQPMQQNKQPHISLNRPILKAQSMNKTTIMARNT
jgi:hypothetical protein